MLSFFDDEKSERGSVLIVVRCVDGALCFLSEKEVRIGIVVFYERANN